MTERRSKPADKKAANRPEPADGRTEEKPVENKPQGDIDTLIDKKIADAKLMVTESRVNHLLAAIAGIMAVFGVIVPLWLTGRNTGEVSQNIEKMEARTREAITKMEDRFKQLAADQLRKPEIACVVEGRDLHDAVLTFTQARDGKIIQVKNIGNKTAEFLDVRLYVGRQDDSVLPATFLDDDYDYYARWVPSYNDEPGYTDSFVRETTKGVVLPAQSLLPVNLTIRAAARKGTDAAIPAMLKVYYGEPEPKRIRFTLRVVSTGKETE